MPQQQSSRFYLNIHDVIRFERGYFVWNLQHLRVEHEDILNIPAILVGPVLKGQPLAELKVSLNGHDLVSEPLRALNDNPIGSFWQRIRDGVKLWFE